MIRRRSVLLAPLLAARGQDRAPNLVLITVSGWRGMAVPWENDENLAAPNLKAFGEQSVVFSRAYCASPKPELAPKALLTSKFPHAAKLNDEPLVKLSPYAPGAFRKTPFAVHVKLVSKGGPGPGMVRLRGNVPPDSQNAARAEVANFYGACRNMDAALGEVLSALDKANLARDTVVCFTGDCGQELLSHGLEGSGVPFEESVRVPLAIRYPRVLKPAAKDLASQVDVMPTLLALCGLGMPEGAQGIDLMKVTREVAFSEGKFGEAGEWRMLVRGYDKLVSTPKGEAMEFYNLAEDPVEIANTIATVQGLRLASMKAQLAEEGKRLGDGMDRSGLRIR